MPLKKAKRKGSNFPHGLCWTRHTLTRSSIPRYLPEPTQRPNRVSVLILGGPDATGLLEHPEGLGDPHGVFGHELAVAGVAAGQGEDGFGHLAASDRAGSVPQLVHRATCQLATAEDHVAFLAGHLGIEVSGVAQGAEDAVYRAGVVLDLGKPVANPLGFPEQVGPLREQARYGMLEGVGSGSLDRVGHPPIVANPSLFREMGLGELAT